MAHQALCPWAFLGKNTRMVCHFLLQEIFLTQGSNPGLLHCRQILSYLSHLHFFTSKTKVVKTLPSWIGSFWLHRLLNLVVPHSQLFPLLFPPSFPCLFFSSPNLLSIPCLCLFLSTYIHFFLHRVSTTMISEQLMSSRSSPFSKGHINNNYYYFNGIKP